jgi:signal transduction histidine kinase
MPGPQARSAGLLPPAVAGRRTRGARRVEVTNIAIVGAGRGGSEFLKVLLNSPNVKIKYVCDTNPSAKGVIIAKQHDIPVVGRFADFVQDPEVDLIFESTGRPDVFEELSRAKLPSASLVGSAGTKVIFSLLDSYNEVNRSLRSYKINLERRIIQRTEELEELNAELAKEKAATEHLYEQQREINEEKSRYLIHTTHQLKAPFAAIQNYVDLILEGYAGSVDPGMRDIVLKIKTRCELLAETIRDMLELAKLKANVVDMVREDVDVRTVIEDVVQRFEVAAAAKRLTLQMDLPRDPLVARTVSKQLFEMLAALMENAVKYSRPDGSIEIGATVAPDGRRVISVADHGIGIPKENQEKIFTEFFRCNNAVRHDPNGNGLGLPIAAEIARLLDVDIELESEQEKGTTFRLRL